jgi:hypothetical protein
MADGLARQDGPIDLRTLAAQGLDGICAARREPCNLSCVRLGGDDAFAQLMHQPSRSRGRRVQPRVLEVDTMRVQPKRKGERCRQHPQHAYAAHQVAVLKGAGMVRREVIGM